MITLFVIHQTHSYVTQESNENEFNFGNSILSNILFDLLVSLSSRSCYCIITNKNFREGEKILASLTSLPVVRVYAFAGHELADQGGFSDTPCPEYRDRVRGDLLRRNRILFLAFRIRGCERVRSWSSSSERIAPVDDTCNAKRRIYLELYLENLKKKKESIIFGNYLSTKMKQLGGFEIREELNYWRKGKGS